MLEYLKNEANKTFTENGAATLAVSRVDEAQALRENGIESNILLLSPPFDEASAKTVVELFSDRVKYFITFNEPQCFIGQGYLQGLHAP